MKTIAGESWRGDILRTCAIFACSALLGLAINAFSSRPVPILSAGGPGAWPERAPRLTLDSLRTALASSQTILILDLRSNGAFETCHPKSALNTPVDRFLEHFGRLNLESLLRVIDTVVLLCESGNCPSADRTAKTLKDLGYSQVSVLEGGWPAYQASDLEREP